MQQKKMPKKVSMAEIVPKSTSINWSSYSRLHDSFLEELSYGKRKFCGADVWQLNYI